jgi:hypothetical protein
MPFNRTVTAFPNTTIPGQRNFEADFFGLRLGPFAEFPINERTTVALSGGLAVAYLDATFSWQESATLGGTTLNTSGSGSHDDWRVGGYVAGTITVALNDRWSLFGSAQYQYLGRFKQVVGGKEAVVDLTKSVFVTVGLGWSF